MNREVKAFILFAIAIITTFVLFIYPPLLFSSSVNCTSGCTSSAGIPLNYRVSHSGGVVMPDRPGSQTEYNVGFFIIDLLVWIVFSAVVAGIGYITKKYRVTALLLALLILISIFVAKNYLLSVTPVNNAPVTSCDSKQTIATDDGKDVTANCGDTIVVNVVYCATCGFSQKLDYDTNLFKITKEEDKSNAAAGAVGGTTTHTYYLQVTGHNTPSTVITALTFRSFENKAPTVLSSVSVKIN